MDPAFQTLKAALRNNSRCVNLYTDQLGNPALPAKLRRARATFRVKSSDVAALLLMSWAGPRVLALDDLHLCIPSTHLYCTCVKQAHSVSVSPVVRIQPWLFWTQVYSPKIIRGQNGWTAQSRWNSELTR